MVKSDYSGRSCEQELAINEKSAGRGVEKAIRYRKEPDAVEDNPIIRYNKAVDKDGHADEA
jgi:hypothetical protein